ncbi:DUF6884 domain-containing protein [Actinokineospora terrae]|uniref:DUF6884 domain-containing protein n=1 Tax=Actinokineospora terrae TaxID=155974 RepID=A0A1H9WPZ6_9PSEU|nr:DUF6884 domain-containing protein [Actinokineospora terrae]SES35998.1 hypothetical protein SAMN04487818_11170 [Actinokineospora terrae]
MTSTTCTRLEPEQGLIIVSCSREKLVTTDPVPAVELYQGALVPQLRDQLSPEHRARVRILSAEHGLLHPDDTVGTYDHKLRTRGEARVLQARITEHLTTDLLAEELRHVLVVLEPLYQLALECLFDHAPPLTLTLAPNPVDWRDVRTMLAGWGWL